MRAARRCSSRSSSGSVERSSTLSSPCHSGVQPVAADPPAVKSGTLDRARSASSRALRCSPSIPSQTGPKALQHRDPAQEVTSLRVRGGKDLVPDVARARAVVAIARFERAASSVPERAARQGHPTLGSLTRVSQPPPGGSRHSCVATSWPPPTAPSPGQRGASSVPCGARAAARPACWAALREASADCERPHGRCSTTAVSTSQRSDFAGQRRRSSRTSTNGSVRGLERAQQGVACRRRRRSAAPATARMACSTDAIDESSCSGSLSPRPGQPRERPRVAGPPIARGACSCRIRRARRRARAAPRRRPQPPHQAGRGHQPARAAVAAGGAPRAEQAGVPRAWDGAGAARVRRPSAAVDRAQGLLVALGQVIEGG